MSLDLFQDRVWAIHPAKLDEINAFIDARLQGRQIQTAQGKNGNRANDSYEIRNGVAIIPVYGVIAKKMNLLIEISGGTSTELLQRDIARALSDSQVESILLDVDSPGGSVDGVLELSDFIRASRSKKPIVAYANGMMASASYWIGSAADAVYTSETSIIGNIGVVLTHFDRSGQDAQRGIQRTEIYAGKYKRIASDTGPLSRDGKDYLQGMVDYYYSIFVDRVAKNRGTSLEQALSMADGKDFIGKQALDAGLVDGIANFNDVLNSPPRKTGKVKTVNPEETFESKVSMYLDRGCSKVDAIRNAAINFPELHAEYIRRHNEDLRAESQASRTPEPEGMYTQIWNNEIEKLKATGLSAGQAVTKLVHSDPALHKAYLAEVNAPRRR